MTQLRGRGCFDVVSIQRRGVWLRETRATGAEQLFTQRSGPVGRLVAPRRTTALVGEMRSALPRWPAVRVRPASARRACVRVCDHAGFVSGAVNR